MREEKATPYHGPNGGKPQVDPGMLDWRLYTFKWSDNTVFAFIVCTNQADGTGTYQAMKEYWFADKAELSMDTALTITQSADKRWAESPPSHPTNCQSFNSPVETTWTRVETDITNGTLFKDSSDNYVRIEITGSAPNADITKVRWYREGSSQPTGTIAPSGSFSQVSSLGSGTFWYADSK
ncbi:MAG: hypothetical protein R3B70_01525 [Polyangiaceae bacterium]